MKTVEDYYKTLKESAKLVANKVKGAFSATSEWLDEIKEADNSVSTEKNTLNLKAWMYLVKTLNWSTINQFKMILVRFRKDIKVSIN